MFYLIWQDIKFTLLAQHQASPFLSQYKKVQWCAYSHRCNLWWLQYWILLRGHMTGFVLCSTATFHAKLRFLLKPLTPPPWRHLIPLATQQGAAMASLIQGGHQCCRSLPEGLWPFWERVLHYNRMLMEPFSIRDAFDAVHNLSNQAFPLTPHLREWPIMIHPLETANSSPFGGNSASIWGERVCTTSQHFCPIGKLLARRTRRSLPPTLPHSRRSFWIYWIRFRDFHNWLISASSPPW